jgi:PDZ domain/CHAT domain
MTVLSRRCKESAWPAAYRLLRGDLVMLIHRSRMYCLDLLLIAPLAAAGIWWEVGRHDNRMGSSFFFLPDEVPERFLVRSHAVQWIPVAVAVLVVLTLGSDLPAIRLRRHGGAKRDDDVEDRLALMLRGALVVPAAIMLFGEDGGLVTRYLPLCAGLLFLLAIAYAGRLPFWKLRTPTRAGFRPSAAALRNRVLRVALMTSRAAESSGSLERTLRAVRVFTSHHDPGTAAYCAARYIESRVARSDWRAAETALQELAGYGLADHPTVIAARSWLVELLGDRPLARLQLVEVRENLAPVPLRLAVLARQDAAGVSVFRFLRLIWSRMDDAVLQAFLDHASALRPDDVSALVLARTVQRCAEACYADRRGGLDPEARIRLALIAAQSAELTAMILADRGQTRLEAAVRFEANQAYGRVAHRAGSGRTLTAAAIATLATGIPDQQAFDQALDLARVGVYLSEEARGQLLDPAHRRIALSDTARAHTRLLDLLAANNENPKCGEIALWLLEARGRTAIRQAASEPGNTPSRRAGGMDRLEELIRSIQEDEYGLSLGDAGKLAELTPGQEVQLDRRARDRHAVWEIFRANRERFPTGSATDISGLLVRLGDAVGLVCSATRLEESWRIDRIVLSRRTGALYQRTDIPVPPGGSWLTSGSLLDSLVHAEAQAGGQLRQWFNTVPMDHRAWICLASALLPGDLFDTLARNSSGNSFPTLVIIPADPLGGLPWAGLPLADGSALIEHADLIFATSISQLKPRPAQPEQASRPPRLLLHFDPKEHGAEFSEWPPRRGFTADAKVTGTRAELLTELRNRDWDIVEIAGHGYTGRQPYLRQESPVRTEPDDMLRLADGTPFSSTSALDVPWPRTVVLGHCWIGYLRSKDGHSAGYPLACMMNGATTVVGAVGPLVPATGLPVLNSALGGHITGGPLYRHLGAQMRSALANERRELAPRKTGQRHRLSRWPAAQWAAISLWTTEAPTVAPADDLHRYWASTDLTPTARRTMLDSFNGRFRRRPEPVPIRGADLGTRPGDPRLSLLHRDEMSLRTLYRIAVGTIILVTALVMVTINEMRDAGATAASPGAIAAAIGPAYPAQGIDLPMITSTTPAGPAARAGLLPGDIISAVDGQSVPTSSDACEQIRRYPPGSRITVILERGITYYNYAVNVVSRDQWLARSKIRDSQREFC